MKIEKTWQDAKTDCEFSGGQLISLDTEEKFNITVEFVDIFGKYVIGLRSCFCVFFCFIWIVFYLNTWN